jgi:hypothetical protein
MREVRRIAGQIDCLGELESRDPGSIQSNIVLLDELRPVPGAGSCKLAELAG